MFYLIDKEKGISSFLAIKKFAKKNQIKKIGHTGTLDPLATGLLLVATDDDTKLINYVDKGFKTYRTEMLLGKISDTYDVDGQIEITKRKIPTFNVIQKQLFSFIGKQKQLPPSFSAKKINGKRAYDLARKGKNFKLEPVNVEISSINNICQKGDYISFDVTVSRGTYIRSLIHDFGQKISCGAIMTNLRRIKIGSLTEEDLDKVILPNDILSLKKIKCNNMKNLLDGKKIPCNYKSGLYALDFQGDIFGIVEVKDNLILAKKLFGNKFRKAGLDGCN